METKSYVDLIVIKGVRFQVYVSSEEGKIGWTSMNKKTIQVSNVMVKDSN